jgi:hypothetical protein
MRSHLTLKAIKMNTEDPDFEIDEEELFRQAYVACTEEFVESDKDSNYNNNNYTESVHALSNGCIHVCKGIQCPHVQQTNDAEKSWICTLSGVQIAEHIEDRTDASTGRAMGSADPDMNSGPVRAWKFRKDAFGESARAYAIARQMTEDDANGQLTVAYTNAASSSTGTGNSVPAEKVKRGALCVSEIDTEEVERLKRQKAQARAMNTETAKVGKRLEKDAASVVTKIFSMNASAAVSSKQQSTQNAGVDPRLENFDFVFAIGIRKYVERCKAAGVRPTLSEIHDVAIQASNFSKEKRRQSKKAREASKGRMFVVSSRTIYMLSTLIVSVWNAVVNTSHFLDTSSGDSFRPFASGILYALKRGIRLKNNMVVIPALPAISNQLPTLRSTTFTQAARQLQASSHRGLCAVHKAIASINSMPEDEKRLVIDKLKVTSSIAKSLEDYTNKYMAEH